MTAHMGFVRLVPFTSAILFIFIFYARAEIKIYDGNAAGKNTFYACKEESCTVQCSGKNSCQNLIVSCKAATKECTLECSGSSNFVCKKATIKCENSRICSARCMRPSGRRQLSENFLPRRRKLLSWDYCREMNIECEYAGICNFICPRAHTRTCEDVNMKCNYRDCNVECRGSYNCDDVKYSGCSEDQNNCRCIGESANFKKFAQKPDNCRSWPIAFPPTNAPTGSPTQVPTTRGETSPTLAPAAGSTGVPTAFCPLSDKCSSCVCSNCPSGAACQDTSKAGGDELLCIWDYRNNTCSRYGDGEDGIFDDGKSGDGAGLVIGILAGFAVLIAAGLLTWRRKWKGANAAFDTTSMSSLSISTRSLVEKLPFSPRSKAKKSAHQPSPSFQMADVSKTITSHIADDRGGAWEIPFKRLTLEKKIGAGGSGQVFKGMYSGHSVAIKELFTTLMDPNDLEEFKKEAMLLASLRHPNIVMFYGVSHNEKCFYIVTEFCPTSLDKILRKGGYNVDPAKTLKMCAEIADAMTFIHERGIIHRDLKPHNILLGGDGSIRICDFGIAKNISNRESMRAHMTMQLGSPAYMAPEILGGYDDEASVLNTTNEEAFKCDVYSYACVVCALWSGAHIYENIRDPMKIIIGVRMKGLRPTINESCPEAIAALLRMCWQERPPLRPAFPEIAAVLRRLQEAM